MPAKPITDHTGQIFPSKEAMCQHWNITTSSFDSRLNRGWSLEWALTKPKGYRPNGQTYIDHEGNHFDSLSDMAKYWNIPDSTLQRRLAVMKLSIKDALTMTTEEAKQNKCYDHLGNEFPSKVAMCEYYKIERQVFFGRIAMGWSLEKALTTPIDFQPANSKLITDHTGKTYKSISAMCKAWNMTRTTYNARIKNGWSIEQALTTPRKEVNMEKQTWKDHNGIEYESLNKMCKAYGITHHTFSTRLNKLGWTLEKALTTSNIINASECTDFMNRTFPTKNDMAHYYGLPSHTFQGKSISNEDMIKTITNRFINETIGKLTIKKVIDFPYFLVIYNNHEYIFHIDKILNIFHNTNFNPIPPTKIKDDNLSIGECVQFPYYNVVYKNQKLIWSYWDIINYRKDTNFGLTRK